MQISLLDDQLNNITDTDTTSYSDALKHADLTVAAQVLTGEILSAMSDWDYQGDTATANIVASTAISNRYYAFPTNFLKLKRIDIMPDGSNWVRCNKVDIGEFSDTLGSETDVTNLFSNDKPYYSIVGNKILILSGTLTAVTNGIRYYFEEMIVGTDTEGTDLTAFAADTDVPNLPEPYQMGLVYYAAKLYFQKYGLTDRIREMNMELYGYPQGRPADEASIGGIVGAMRKFKITNEPMILKTPSDLENYE